MEQEQAADVTLQDALVEAHGLRLHYRAWQPVAGAPTDLPPILLIHGLASAACIWDLTAPLLARRGFRVVALDQRGHGESDKPDHGYTFEEILADDHAAAAELGLERPIVVGHSWGGGVVLNYAATFPEEVRAIVLVDGGFTQMGQRTGWTKERMLQELAPPQFAGTPAEVFLTYPRRGPLAQVWSPQLEDIFLHIVELRADGTVAPRLSLANHLQILEAMWDQPTLALYDRVTCPVLLVCPEQQATDDRQRQFQAAKREAIARILEAHPGVRVEYLADTIHDVPLQRPEALAGLIAQMADEAGG
jgi:pimeloyl-ACP methyl ester carboxylesterase